MTRKNRDGFGMKRDSAAKVVSRRLTVGLPPFVPDISEHDVPIIRACQIVVVLQRGQSQAFAEAARVQEQQLVAGILDQRDAVGAINVEVALRGNFYLGSIWIPDG